MSQQALNEKECEFDTLLEQMKEAERKKLECEKLCAKLHKEYSELRRKVEGLCDHKWEVDHDSYDHKNHYDCVKCGAYR